MRCTLVWLIPISLAMLRTLQCVALTGRSFTVFSTTLSLIAALIGFLPGGLERPSTRPSTPASAKYSCQRQTVVLETPTSCMIAVTPWPSAVMRMILARLTIFWGVFPSVISRCSWRRAFRSSTNRNSLCSIREVNHHHTRDSIVCDRTLGNVLKELCRADEAAKAYRRALALRPDFAEAYTNLG